MGAVYRAWDINLKMPVAVKANFETSPEAQRQFEREASILARLSHPNLPRVTDYFSIPNRGQYLVMDFVEGEDLQAMLNRLGMLPEPQVLTWVMQICDALSYLHSQPSPIIHRDVKPANIKVRADGRAMLVDFGIAKVFDPAMPTTIGAKAVTPGYSPPEQYGEGTTDARSDIYALGATIYHLLTGKLPPESVQRMVQAVSLPLPHQLNQSITSVTEQAILKAVEITTDRRFQSVEEFRAALTTHPVMPQSTEVIPPQQLEPTQYLSQKRKLSPGLKWGLIGGAAVLLVILSIAVLSLSDILRTDKPWPTVTVAVVTDNIPTLAVVPIQAPPTHTSPSSVTLVLPPSTPTNLPQPTELPSTDMPTDIPQPTDTPQPTFTPSCPVVHGPFASVWNIVQGEIGCATGNVVNGAMAEENFERGKMFWREPIDHAQALVLFSNGTWRIYQHTPFVEGSPDFSCLDADTPPQCPPTPKRGFGMMWCDIPEIRNGLGNATDCERGYQGIMQQFERGFMLQTDNGSTYVFHNDGRWERR